MKNNAADIDKKYDLFIEERKILVKSLQESSRTFDKAILTLASGSFVLSFAFIKDLVPRPITGTIWLLHYSWFFFALSILLILISFLTSQKACLKQIENSFASIIEEKKEIKNTWSYLTSSLNYSSILFLLIGCIYWIVFVCNNF